MPIRTVLISSWILFHADILALRFVAGNTITSGEYEKGRDTFAWALAFWTEDMKLYPYVLALYVSCDSGLFIVSDAL